MNQPEPTTVKFPKRSRLKNTCADCGTPILAANRYCPDCKQKRQEEKEGVRSWKSPTGETIKRKVAQASVSENVVFEISGSKFPVNSPSGPFLETLIGICYRRPSYIHDAVRYASLINDLIKFPFTQLPGGSDLPKAVGDTPLNLLGPALRDWVMSFFDVKYHPLMATIALDAAGFVIAHGAGKWMYSPASMPALLVPMIDGDFFCDNLFDSAFKRNFTQHLGGRSIFLAEIPEGGAIVRSNAKLFGPGTRFLFRMVRCHLSDGWDECVFLQTKEEFTPDYDINEIILPGVIWLDSSNSLAVSYEDVCDETERRLDIPLQWITHAILIKGDTEILMPVPRWE